MNTRLEIASRILATWIGKHGTLEPFDTETVLCKCLYLADLLIIQEQFSRKPEPSLEKGVDTKS